jgi:hypothetical protein
VIVALPFSHYLCDAYPPDRVRELQVAGRTLLAVGDLGEGADICVDAASGEVVLWDPGRDRLEHVNRDLESFVRSLEVFAARDPFYAPRCSYEERETAAHDLLRDLVAIDDTCLRTEGGFWDQIVLDVWAGDYADGPRGG